MYLREATHINPLMIYIEGLCFFLYVRLQLQLVCYSLEFAENIFIITSWRGVPTYACEMLSLQVCWEQYDSINIGLAVFFFKSWGTDVSSSFAPSIIINVDETRISYILLNKKLLSVRGKIQVGMLTTEERGWATVSIY